MAQPPSQEIGKADSGIEEFHLEGSLVHGTQKEARRLRRTGRSQPRQNGAIPPASVDSGRAYRPT